MITILSRHQCVNMRFVGFSANMGQTFASCLEQSITSTGVGNISVSMMLDDVTFRHVILCCVLWCHVLVCDHALCKTHEGHRHCLICLCTRPHVYKEFASINNVTPQAHYVNNAIARSIAKYEIYTGDCWIYYISWQSEYNSNRRERNRIDIDATQSCRVPIPKSLCHLGIYFNMASFNWLGSAESPNIDFCF